MTKVKLVNGTIINAESVEVLHGTLHITVKDAISVESLAEIFSNKENTSLIVLMTEKGTECGYKIGFTSFAGIMYNADGSKAVQLFQPKDVTEERVAKAEGNIAQTNKALIETNADLAETNANLAQTNDVIDSMLVQMLSV